MKHRELVCGLVFLFPMVPLHVPAQEALPEQKENADVPGADLLPEEGNSSPPLDLPEPGSFTDMPTLPPPVEPAPTDETQFVLPRPTDVLHPTAVPLAEITVRLIRFEGNTLIPSGDLDDLARSYTRRPILQEDLDELRLRIAALYLSRGYPNSGAVIPDQELKDGVMLVRIIEGRLTDAIVRCFREEAGGGRTDVTKDRVSVAPAYFKDRILVGNQRPLNLAELQNRLQILQSNPNLQRINAELKPGAVPGEAILLMEVTERKSPRWNAGLDIHNQRSPSVGGEQAEIWMESTNATGCSDEFSLRLGLLTGDQGKPKFDPGQTASLRYSRAVTARDTTLDLFAERQDYVILDEIFSPLDIEGESSKLGLVMRHPLIRSFGTAARKDASSGTVETTVRNDLWAGLAFDHSQSETRLLGEPFSISPGYVNGELDLSVLRLPVDWTRRTDDSVLALRSTLSIGIDGLGSTDSPSEPDASFVSWAAAGQYSRRIGSRGDSATFRGGFQWASDTMPSPEQWILGGRYTVRGYPENSLVSDMGWFGSFEYSLVLPVAPADSEWRISLVPFVDTGSGWNHDRGNADILLSCGTGLRVEYSDWFRGELFWGRPFSHEELTEGDDLQDDGIHFRFTLSRF